VGVTGAGRCRSGAARPLCRWPGSPGSSRWRAKEDLGTATRAAHEDCRDHAGTEGPAGRCGRAAEKHRPAGARLPGALCADARRERRGTRRCFLERRFRADESDASDARETTVRPGADRSLQGPPAAERADCGRCRRTRPTQNWPVFTWFQVERGVPADEITSAIIGVHLRITFFDFGDAAPSPFVVQLLRASFGFHCFLL
jgi:hypothetical protein